MHDAITQIRQIMAQLYREGKTPNLALVRSRCSLSPATLFSLYAQCRHLTADDLGVSVPPPALSGPVAPCHSDHRLSDQPSTAAHDSADIHNVVHAAVDATSSTAQLNNLDALSADQRSEARLHQLLCNLTEQFQQQLHTQMQLQAHQITALRQQVSELQAQLSELTLQVQHIPQAVTVALHHTTPPDTEEATTC